MNVTTLWYWAQNAAKTKKAGHLYTLMYQTGNRMSYMQI